MDDDLIMANEDDTPYDKGYADGFAEGFERGKTMPRSDDSGNILISEEEYDKLSKAALIAIYLRDLIDMVKDFKIDYMDAGVEEDA